MGGGGYMRAGIRDWPILGAGIRDLLHICAGIREWRSARDAGFDILWCGNAGLAGYMCGNPGLKKRAGYGINHVWCVSTENNIKIQCN